MKSAEQRAIEALYPDAYKLAEDQSGALQSTMNLSPLFWDMSNQVEPGPLKFDLPPTTGIPSQDNPDAFQQYEALLERKATDAERRSYDLALTQDPRNYANLLDSAVETRYAQRAGTYYPPKTDNLTPPPRDEVAATLKQSILKQGATSQWTAGNGIRDNDYLATKIANKLVDSGITRLEDFGVRKEKVNYPASYDENGNPQYVEVEQNVYYNKSTGQAIPADYDRAGGPIWSGTFEGSGSTGYGVSFNELGMPIFYTQYGGSTSDWGTVSQVLSIASMIPGPHQPFTMALNAIGQAANGNTTGAVLSALGAASTYGAQYLNTSIMDPSVPFDQASANLNTVGGWLAQNAGAIQTAAQAVGVLNALDTGNVAGVISGLLNIAPQVGVTIPSDIIKPLNVAAMASAASKGDWTGALTAASMLTSNPAMRQDLNLAKQAVTFQKAIESGNPAAILSSVIGLAKNQNLGAAAVRDVAKQTGAPMSESVANQFLASEDPDQHVKEYYAQTQAARDAYEKETGQQLPDSFFEQFQAFYTGDSAPTLAQAADNLTTTDAESSQIAKDVFGKDIDKGLLANAPAGLAEDQYENWIQGIYDTVESAAGNADFTEDQKNALTSFAMGAPEYLDTVQKSMRYLDAFLPKEQVDAFVEKSGGWSGAMDYLATTGSPEEAAEAVARDYLFDRDSKQFTQSELSTQIPLKDGQATSMYGLVWTYGADEAKRMFDAYKSGEKIELPAEIPSMRKLEEIRKDESTFDSGELAAAYKDIYGKEPTNEWLAENIDLLGRSDAQAKNMLQNLYVEDKNSVTKDEAIEFLKKAGLKESDVTQTQLESALKGSEPGVETFFQTLADRKATTFDGSDYERQSDAQAQAIRSGFNTYEWGGKDYTIMSPEQAKQLQADRDSGKNVGVSPDQIFMPVPGKTLEQQLKDAGDPDEYAYQQGDTITIVAKKLATPDYEDTEAWNAFKAEKQALGGDNFQSFLTEQFSILEQAMKGAPKDSVAKVMADAAMFGYGKMAQLAETFSRTGEAMGIPQAERGTNIAKQVQSWSNKLVDQGIQNAEAAVLANVAAVTKESLAAERGVKPSDISTAELYAQKTAALFKQVPNNPLGVSLFLAGEGIQEIPLLAVSGGVGSVFKNVIGRSVGLSAAVGTNVALNGAEAFGGNYGEVKEYLTKQGVPSSQIEALAVKSGLEGMAVGMMTAYAGDRALIKSFMGDLAKDSFGKVVATNSAREWFMGNLEGSLQNMSAQIGKYGSIKSEDEWLNAGIMEGFAQKGIAAGVLTAASLDKAVAKDYDGKPVTYKEVIEGTKTFDPKTLDKEFSFGNGVNLGDAIGYHSTFITNPDITPDEYFYAAQTFRDNGMADFTPQEVASIVGTPGEMSQGQISEVAQPYAQERVVTPQEAQQMMRDLGYTNFTDAEAVSLAGQISEADARAKAQEYVAPRQVTREEATDFFASIPGYTPTKEDIDAFVRQGADINQENVRAELEQYIDPRLVSEQEVRDAYAALGLAEPAQADIDKLVGQYAQESLAGRAQENLGTAQFNVTTANQEAAKKAIADLEAQTKAQYDALSTAQKVEADARIAQGQTLQEAIAAAQATTAGQISDLEAQTTEQYESLTAAQKATADALVAQGKTLQDAIATAKTETAGQIAGVETRLTDAIAAAEAMGLSRDQAITAAVDSVAAELGTTRANLLAQLGTTEAALRTEFGTGLAGVSAEVKAAYDSLSAEQKALANQLTQQGTDLATAIQQAQQQTQGQIGALSADMQAKYDALTAEQKALANNMAQQGMDLTAAINLAQQQTQAQITGLGQQVDTRINELMQQGQTYQAATQQAIGELTQQNQQLQGLVGTQGRQATQADIDALSQMLGGQRSMDLTYDVTGDKQITQADIDFLTQVVGGTKTDWTAPVGSAFGPTGLYGQLATNEAQRKADLQAQLAREQAAEQARAAQEAQAAAAAKEAQRQAAIRANLGQGQQQLQQIAKQVPQAFQQAQTTTTPIYGEMGPYLDLGSPLDFDFFKPSPEKQAATKQQQPTKIATGGYIDDLLAGDMTVDELLNLLR